MSENSSIIENENPNEPFDKRVSFKLIQLILSASAVYLTTNNLNLISRNLYKLPSSLYPNRDQLYVFRQQFTLALSVLCILYAALLSGFFLVLKSGKSSEDDDSLDVDLRKRRYTRTNKLITKAGVIIDFLLILLCVGVASGFLFPIIDQDTPIDVKSVSCTASQDDRLQDPKPWLEICNSCNSLIVIEYTLSISYLSSGIFGLLYLNKSQ
eukprot:NODE_71_length_24927_cov_1.205937.p15 type:complete len:211 gc:universal NODE_71_length_24927_cov_1.205937:23094-22462(-)